MLFRQLCVVLNLFQIACAIASVYLFQHFQRRGDLSAYPAQRPFQRVRFWVCRQLDRWAVFPDKPRPAVIELPVCLSLLRLSVHEADIVIDDRKCRLFCVIMGQQFTDGIISSFIFQSYLEAVLYGGYKCQYNFVQK